MTQPTYVARRLDPANRRVTPPTPTAPPRLPALATIAVGARRAPSHEGDGNVPRAARDGQTAMLLIAPVEQRVAAAEAWCGLITPAERGKARAAAAEVVGG